ncbi:hypothetical protein OS493_004336 [Desmophyllum pertusum]|uniref:RING-type domain-containing protein n=1 Tax=Desmophyllum pertusum TaxID=174260 RepID=A0A9X0D579_9CNID|nr:hypothetical protein OS493_004336 [Desmophyllum pertusum]
MLDDCALTDNEIAEFICICFCLEAFGRLLREKRSARCYGQGIMEKMSEINGIPAEKQWAFFGVKPLRIDLRLSEYDIRHESTILLAIRTPGGSEQTPAKVLDDTVELSDAPDMITWNDDPENKRAKMPCGHAITPESLTMYCRSILNAGRSRFVCPYPISQDEPPVFCGQEWEYIDVRRLAVLTGDEKKYFEEKIAKNYLFKSMGLQECPECKSLMVRPNKTTVQVVCLLCSKNKNTTYHLCWHCLHKWVNSGSRTQCGNVDCSGEDRRLKVLRSCDKKTIGGVVECPTIRACVSCGLLIEHEKACKHMHCRCGKDFCFICLKPKEGNGWQCGGLQ